MNWFSRPELILKIKQKRGLWGAPLLQCEQFVWKWKSTLHRPFLSLESRLVVAGLVWLHSCSWNLILWQLIMCQTSPDPPAHHPHVPKDHPVHVGVCVCVCVCVHPPPPAVCACLVCLYMTTVWSLLWWQQRQHATAHLPASRAVAVAFVLEIRHRPHHPVIDLGQGQPFLGGALDGLGNEVCIGVVAPGVPAGGGLPQLLGGRAAQSRGGGLRRGGRAVGGLLPAGAALDLHGLGDGAAARLPGLNTAVFLRISAPRAAALIILLFGDYVSVIRPGLARTRLRTGKGPSAGARPLLGLEIRIDLDVGGRLVAAARRLSHFNRDISVGAQRVIKSLRSHSINVVCGLRRRFIYYARYAKMSSLQPRPKHVSLSPSVLLHGVQSAALTTHRLPPCTAHTPADMHGNAVWNVELKTGRVSAECPDAFLHRRPAPRSRDVHATETEKEEEKKKLKTHHSTLMPPHQLYHSAHSCHLDHFLLSQVLYHPRWELPAAWALRCCPDTIKAKILPFLKAPAAFFFLFFLFFFLKGGWWRNVARLKSAEKKLVHPGCMCVEPAAAARWCPLLCASSSLQTLHSICCCCALRKRSESKRRRKKKRKEKKTSILPPALHWN